MNYLEIGEINLFRRKDEHFLFFLVAVNLIIKAIPAVLLELGNDEVYYWTYALFPDWSHFDHPPMVGLLIQLFSANLTLHNELFMRAGALILSSANIVILFYLVRRIYSRHPAFFSVLMYISSVYFNIISGLFILPDTPQIFFILLALYNLLPAVTSKEPTGKDKIKFILFGLFSGLAFLSKYHSLFLWFGAGSYILFHNRIWFRKPAFYISILITIVLMFPVIYWNLKNDFISFTFHGGRVGLFHNPLNLVSFTQFNLGQFFYQNPVLYAIYAIAIYKTLQKRKDGIRPVDVLLLYTAIPLILGFTILSLFRSVLPHWTGPAFITLLILSSEYLADNYNKRRKAINWSLSFAIGMFLFVLVSGYIQINYGVIEIKSESASFRRGKNDFTLDMYGWKQAGEKFKVFLVKEGISENDYRHLALITDKWFPAAHIDYYMAYPLKIKLIVFGGVERIHKYYWINKRRKLSKTDRIFYITDSRNYNGPEAFSGCFKEIIPLDTLIIDRNNKPVKYIYIYDMVDFKCDTILNSPHPGF